MQTINHLLHAYKQAPWRVQRQRIGVFFLVLLLFSMVAALYLNITSRAAIIGRQIQIAEMELAANERINANLTTELATRLSKANMEQRALALGYSQVEPEDIEYLVVPGYQEPKDFRLAEAPGPKLHAPSVPPEYTQSLLDWIDQRLRTPAFSPMAGSR